MVEKETSKLAGIFSLNSSVIPWDKLPEEYRSGTIPHIPVPAILIGRFGLDKAFKHQGLSYDLLAKTYEVIIFHYKQDLIAFKAIRVDTRVNNPEAYRFWKKHNYIECVSSKKSSSLLLFLPIELILKQ
jgi:hypothetical protein